MTHIETDNPLIQFRIWEYDFIAQYWYIFVYHDGDEFNPIGHTQKTFEEGANYVLEEIGKLINYKRWSAQDLYKVINELKK